MGKMGQPVCRASGSCSQGSLGLHTVKGQPAVSCQGVWVASQELLRIGSRGVMVMFVI